MIQNNGLSGMSSCYLVLHQFNIAAFLTRFARTGPSLPETFKLLTPLASTLEVLSLGGNPLGGTITGDVSVFSKLTELALHQMGLEGACSVLAQYNKQTNEGTRDQTGF